MFQPALFALGVVALVSALAAQVPLTSNQHWQDEIRSTLTDEDLTEWSLKKLPSSNTTDHLVFETVHSLLQKWPNTRMRNGHSIVPGVIPKGTLLYHGTPASKIPTGPEWVATDPEHSHLFCRRIYDPIQQGGWLLTLMVTRPLKVVYFDGSSAAKLSYGSMDTQDLIVWGKPSSNDDLLTEEVERIRYLCDWGKRFGVDGFVRMQMDFEVILCDFTSGVSVISFEHVTSDRSIPPMVSRTEVFEVMNAGARHNHFPGETRIQLDLAGLVSFYDTQLAPSLVPIRTGQERWDHRTINISGPELSAITSRLETNLLRPDSESSGIDWKTLIQVIVDRYADRLELTRYLVNSSAADPNDILDRIKKAQTQLRIMLTPYLLFSAAPTDPSDKTNLDWTIPIYKLCATTHTQSIELRFEVMTDSEKLILQAIRGTSREICRVVTKIWAAGVYAGIDPSLNASDSPDVAEVSHLRDTLGEELNRLMSWLDWSVWVKCNPGCGFEETCYLPTWPLGFPWLASRPSSTPFPIDADNDYLPEPDEWIRPQPKCIRRTKPYTF